MKKINILFVLPQLEKGGSETLVYTVASRLDRSMFDVSVAYLYYYGNNSFRQAFLQKNIKLYHIPRTNGLPFSTMQKMAKIIRDEEIQVVNAHHFVSMVNSFYACKSANRVGLIYTEHSSWEVERVSYIWKLLGGMLLRRLDCVTGISDDVTNALRAKFNLRKESTLTIRNGVDLEGNKTVRDVNTVRNEFNLSDDTKIVAMVANFRRVKNHLYLLREFKELANELGNVKLLLIGQGTDDDPENSEEDILSYVRKNGLQEKVILTGYRSDVLDLLSIANVFCLTSYREGLPISMLEAMSIGLPVIGTNVLGIRDVIINRRNGLLVELNENMALKNALLKILKNDDLQHKYGQESRMYVKAKYSMEDTVNLYKNLFIRYSKRH